MVRYNVDVGYDNDVLIVGSGVLFVPYFAEWREWSIAIGFLV